MAWWSSPSCRANQKETQTNLHPWGSGSLRAAAFPLGLPLSLCLFLPDWKRTGFDSTACPDFLAFPAQQTAPKSEFPTERNCSTAECQLNGPNSSRKPKHSHRRIGQKDSRHISVRLQEGSPPIFILRVPYFETNTYGCSKRRDHRNQSTLA